MDSEDFILSIILNIDTNHKIGVKYSGEIVYDDKDDFQKAAVVFWDVLKANGLPVSKYNKCDDLEFVFENGAIQMKDEKLICTNILPTTYEFFYCLLEEYKKRIK